VNVAERDTSSGFICSRESLSVCVAHCQRAVVILQPGQATRHASYWNARVMGTLCCEGLGAANHRVDLGLGCSFGIRLQADVAARGQTSRFHRAPEGAGGERRQNH